MAGTRAGELKAHAKIIEKYGKDHYREIGRKGGQNGHTGGFASASREFVVECGRKGGRISRRTGIQTGQGKSPCSLRRYAKEAEEK